MRKTTISKLTIGDRVISFREGINYVVGNNGSGKTFLFKTMQYALGLISESSFFHFDDKPVKLSLFVDGESITFSRDINSSFISILIDNNEESFRPRTSEYRRFLHHLFLRDVLIDFDSPDILRILRYSFFGGQEAISKTQFDDFKLMLRSDPGKERSVRRQINRLRDQIKNQEFAINEVDRFVSITNSIYKDRFDSDTYSKINELQKQVFSDYLENKNEFDEALVEAREYESYLKNSQDDKFKMALSDLVHTVPSNMGEFLRFHLDGYLESHFKHRAISAAEDYLFNLMIRVLVQIRRDVSLGLGFVVNDANERNFLDPRSYDLEFDLVDRFQGDFQYIAFTQVDAADKDKIILNLDKGWFK